VAAGAGVEARELPEGRLTASWSSNRVRMWTGVSDPQCVAAGRCWVAAGGENGRVYLLRGRDATLAAWPQVADSPVRSIALHPGEGLVAAGTDQGGLYLLRLPAGEVVAQSSRHRDGVAAMAFSGSGLLASGSRDRTVRLWRCEGGALHEVLSLPMPGVVRWLGFHPDRVRLFVLLDGEGAVRVYHLDRLRRQLTELGQGEDLEPIEARALPPPAPSAADPAPVVEPPSGPNGLKAELFADLFPGRCLKVRVDPQIHFDWETNSPAPVGPGDSFLMRWTGWLKAPRPGRYTLELESHGGSRLWLDGMLQLDLWRPGDERYTVEVVLGSRPHALRVDCFQGHDRLARVRLGWAQAGGFAMQPISARYLFHDRASAEKTSLSAPPPLTAERVGTLTVPGDRGSWVSFTHDGKQLITGGHDGSVRLWDLGTGKQVQSFSFGKYGLVRCLSQAADGKRVLASCGGVVALWDPDTGQEVRRFTGHQGQIIGLARSPRSSLVACRSWISGVGTHDVRVWDVNTGKIAWQLPRPAHSVFGFCWTADGKALLTAGDDGRLDAWDPVTKQRLWEQRIPQLPPLGWLDSSPDGAWLAVTRQRPGTLDLYARQGKRLEMRWRASCGQAPDLLRFSPDGQLIAVLDYPLRLLTFWDVRTGLEVGRIEFPGTSLHDFAWSPDSTQVAVAVAKGDRPVLLWKLANKGLPRR
jgi:WD40 repeat protein